MKRNSLARKRPTVLLTTTALLLFAILVTSFSVYSSAEPIHSSHTKERHQDTSSHNKPPHYAAAASSKPNSCHRLGHVCQNGATCVTKPDGHYQCQCVNGWTGQNCTENVNDCNADPCNGGICHDRVGSFWCECPAGKVGLVCQHDNGCYGPANPCASNATCDPSPLDGKATCTCGPGFQGDNCSVDINECDLGAPCEHNGVCVNEPGWYRCDCAQGFTGPRCEVDINECAENPCVNGGTCLDEQGGYRCVCPLGFTGRECQIDIDECAANPCENGATCKDEVNSFRCLCQPGYWGVRCESNSSSVHRNGPQAPLAAIETLSPQNPWYNCPAALFCWAAFSDNKCDQVCNNAECLFDGKDCGVTSNATRGSASTRQQVDSAQRKCDNSFCIASYGNGHCDLECNNPECGWDGMDCDQPQDTGSNSIIEQQPSTRANGLLVMRLQPAVQLGTNRETKEEVTRLLMNLYTTTGSLLKIQNYRDVDDSTEIELIADNRRCLSECFNSTDLMARFLTALQKKNNKTMEQMSGLKIESFVGRPNDQLIPESQQMSTYQIWIPIFGTVAIFCAAVMVVSINATKRETKKAFNWFPEGFKTTTSTSKGPRRDPAANRKGGESRGISTLSAVSGKFIRGFKSKERYVSTDPNCGGGGGGRGNGGGFHSTDIDHQRATAATPNGGGIYHEPYDYDQYGSTYIGAEPMANHHQQPMTPTPMPMNPINIEGPHGMTPLMVASMGQPFSTKDPLGLVTYGTTGEVDASENNVTDLLNRGAQLNLASKVTGETALHLAARCGRSDNAQRLLAHCDSKDVNAKDATGRTPLHSAIAADSLGVFELLIRNRGTDLNAQTHDGTTPLILAAKVGNYSMLEELILNECEVTKSDVNGKTALHWAAAVNNVDIIRRLLAVRETNKDAQDLAEETPLFLAAREGARGAVEILLSHNANKDIKDQLDVSPMEIARSKKHDDIVRLLEEYEPTSPRSLTAPHHSRQISPLSPDSTSNSNGSMPTTAPPPYLSYTHLNGGNHLSEGGRKAQRAAALHDAYSVPCLKDFMTPSPDSPYSLDSQMVSPPVGYTASQQYQNFHQAVITSTKHADEIKQIGGILDALFTKLMTQNLRYLSFRGINACHLMAIFSQL